MIKTRIKLQFLLHCKHNNIFPSHLMYVNEKRFHLSDYKSFSRFGTALHRFRKTILDIEIFDLNRIIDSLTEELSYNSRILFDSLPIYMA